MPVISHTQFHAIFRRELLDMLRLLSFQKREVTLSSGRKSNFYIDCKQTVLTARGHFLTGWLMLWELQGDEDQRFGRAGDPGLCGVGGLTMGADPIVSAISTLSTLSPDLPGFSPNAINDLEGFYVRKEPKKHGTSRWIEAPKTLAEGNHVAIVEDVITTGASAIKAIKAAREHGLHVRQVLALVDREEDNGRQNLEKELGDDGSVTALFKQSDFR